MLVHLNSLQLGGTQINAVDLAAEMRGRGVESILVGARDTIPDGPSMIEIAAARDMEILLYDPAPSIFTRARQLSALARRHGVDVVHVYGSWGGGARPAYWGPCRFARTPWVQTVYEMSVSAKMFRHMPMIVGTGYQRDEQHDRPGRTILISPPVDLIENHPDVRAGTDFRGDNRLDAAPLLVIVSRLDVSMKSVPINVAIDAMRVLARTGANLAIVGTGDNVAAIQSRADDVNNEAGRLAVRLVGALADPRPAYAAADIVLGMGGSAARALAFAKPLVVQGEAGWSQVFDSSSAESLARSSFWSPDSVPDPAARLVAMITPLLSDPDRRAELGGFGRSFAEERFGLTAMADRLIAFYRTVQSDYTSRDWFADLPIEGRMLSAKFARIGRHALGFPGASPEGAR
ncbi:glycosyltransferase [Cryobacterium melibiosiphilum]|uniref:D-inositol 3-phosphate glycosyltransferase n=1 Tax=Cryobacterium melibiosiphilum TaxID=995039 RepID=A0A3A5MWL8_9MICO|nr:glycosyltransferase family 4 protein [Cryobacterium melibiosiphilum]RJT89584.1 glycosyltransferase [Cryobacterium melibiosiphilum]